MISLNDKSNIFSNIKLSYSIPNARALADQYFYGEGTQQNLTEALRWYLIAAEGGDQIAQSFLNICLENLHLNLDNIQTLNTADWFDTIRIQ